MAQPELSAEERHAGATPERASAEMPRLPRAASRGGWARLPRKAPVALARRILAPLAIALVPLFWVIDATNRASLATLGRDQGIFQYVAWAVGEGDVDYRDVRDVNGPLTHLLHRLMLALGGADEHRFHVLDLAATGIAFAVVGACLPGLVSRRSPTRLERAAWASAAWVVLSAQYHLYTYWNQAQRESFCDWFLLPSLALQAAFPARDGARAARRVAVVAALSVVTWFGKPTFAAFTVMQLAVLLVDREVPLARRERLRAFAAGGALGAALPLAYLFAHGDAMAFLRITLLDVPRVYRFMWANTAAQMLGQDFAVEATAAGIAAAVVLLALALLRELPRRALVLAFAPLCAVANVLAQGKGFSYHFHPLTASTHLAWLAVVVMLSERFRVVPRKRPLGRYVALAAAAALGLHVASSLRASPHLRDEWILSGGETADKRASPAYFARFRTGDYYPWELRQVAAYLREVTPATARVQTYGMDPYLLFLAERRSATPYIYAYDLNASAALEGGFHNEPTEAQAAIIRATRDAHERDLLARLAAAPPEAFVFVDGAPLTERPAAWDDFGAWCAETAAWVRERYALARSFGGVIHVWLRRDLATGAPEAP
jgi:hypothetical protein